MNFRIILLLAIIVLLGKFSPVSAQVDSVIGQLTNSPVESFAGGISGDGRLVVFESTANLATENPRNADGNREIFLFDYAQRRIFQITDTTSLRTNVTNPFVQSNIKVSIVNLRPVISNDGSWIAFGSNATIAFPGTGSVPPVVSTSNPGNFNADSFTDATGNNTLTADGNTELWLYQIPVLPPADLSSGEEIAVTDLSGGTFTRVTNTLPSRLPFAGTAAAPPVIADDNRDASINDNGNYTAFTSNRDLVPTVGNASPNANDEIFTFVRNSNTVSQVTQTARGTVVDPIYNQTPTISGNGLRVAFQSNADNPIRLMTGGSNTDRNIEVFFADLDSTGNPTATSIKRQVTTTARVNPGDVVNVLDFGRRMSRDGRYIAFDSFADLAGESGGTNQTSFALYLFDANVAAPSNPFRRIGPRSDADPAASGGDVAHYPGFTDTDANGTPATLVLETRQNILANGTIAPNNESGLNQNAARPPQIYSYPLNVAPASATFTRLTTFPTPSNFIPSTQPIPSNSRQRMTFNLALIEIGTGNSDLASEAFYFLLPTTLSQSSASFSFATGASRIPVSASPVPTPTPSPLPSPSPTPITPSAVQGVSPGMLVILDFTSGSNNQVVARTAVGSLQRSFTLPIELSGVTLTVNGAAAGLKSVSQQAVVFVVPPGLTAAGSNPTVYPVVVNNNGIVFRGSITIVPARPDVFTFSPVPAPNGRAQIFNITNTVFRTEPFNVTTLRIRGGRRVPTVLRLFLTGVNGVTANNITVRIGDTTLTGAQLTTGAVLREPGVYSIDFALPPGLFGAGDVPIIISVLINGVTYQSRLDDTAPRFRIL
ncbi:MAG: hypothetical protein H0W45_05515 [Acidobacteria bacterium]|nr:hypothetical protein [Acidobacteriota bacterium]